MVERSLWTSMMIHSSSPIFIRSINFHLLLTQTKKEKKYSGVGSFLLTKDHDRECDQILGNVGHFGKILTQLLQFTRYWPIFHCCKRPILDI